MVQTIHIENIGIISNITVDFKEGLSILTGSTGAGKTLIIDALQLICGNRFSKEVIKTGKEFCLVEIMILDENPNSENIIVSREVNIFGKNKCKINGRMVTVNELKEYMSNVINIHGQNDNQNLLDETKHIEYLDAYCKEELNRYKLEYIKLYTKYQELNSELLSDYGNPMERKRKLDLLEYEINEIEESNLNVDEEKELEEKSKIIRNSEKIYNALNISENSLNDNVINSLDSVLKELNKIEEFNTEYKGEKSRLESAYYEIKDVAENLYNFKDEMYFDENQASNVTKRLDIIYTLKRKYGNNIEEILEYNDKIKQERNKIQNMEEHLKKVEENVKNIKKDMLELSKKMNDLRCKYSIMLEEKVNLELEKLEMKNAKIKICIDFDDNLAFNSNGLSKVKFKIMTNIGDEYKSLNKIASGGEISRIMLAIKKVLTQVDNVPVLIFDEVDTGISGKAGKAVGSMLKVISLSHQVICITHLAVVAAFADNHYYISKNVTNNMTFSNIKLLDKKESLNEVARIITGEVTNASLSSAEELIKNTVFCI